MNSDLELKMEIIDLSWNSKKWVIISKCGENANLELKNEIYEWIVSPTMLYFLLSIYRERFWDTQKSNFDNSFFSSLK